MLSLFCVLVVVAQPTVDANSAMTLIMLNETCFIFSIPSRFAVALEMISSPEENFAQEVCCFCGLLSMKP
jgi:hypothetical protein